MKDPTELREYEAFTANHSIPAVWKRCLRGDWMEEVARREGKWTKRLARRKTQLVNALIVRMEDQRAKSMNKPERAAEVSEIWSRHRAMLADAIREEVTR